MTAVVALGVATEVTDAVEVATGLSLKEVAALTTLGNWADGQSIERLRAVLGMSQPGCARLVDRLVAERLARRGADRRRPTSHHRSHHGGRPSRRRDRTRRPSHRGAEAGWTGCPPDAQDRLGPLLDELAGARIRASDAPAALANTQCRLCDHGGLRLPGPLRDDAGIPPLTVLHARRMLWVHGAETGNGRCWDRFAARARSRRPLRRHRADHRCPPRSPQPTGTVSGPTPVPAPPVDYVAGDVCPFPVHETFPVNRVVAYTYTDASGRVVAQYFTGALIGVITRTDTGKTIRVGLSGKGVELYDAAGDATLYGIGPYLVGLHAGDTPGARDCSADGPERAADQPPTAPRRWSTPPACETCVTSCADTGELWGRTSRCCVLAASPEVRCSATIYAGKYRPPDAARSEVGPGQPR